jgi:hypothetical protein
MRNPSIPRHFVARVKLLIIFSVLALSVRASSILDQQILVGNYQELSKVENLLRSAGHVTEAGVFAEAVTYISTYADSGCLADISPEEASQLLVSLVNNKSPRQIIVLGHVLQLERMRLALASEGQSMDTQNSEDRNLAKIRRDLATANLNAAIRVIRSYIVH